MFKSNLVNRIDGITEVKIAKQLLAEFKDLVFKNSKEINKIDLSPSNCTATYDKGKHFVLLKFKNKDVDFNTKPMECIVKADLHYNMQNKGTFDIFKITYFDNGLLHNINYLITVDKLASLLK